MTDNPRAGYVRYTRINLCVGSTTPGRSPLLRYAYEIRYR
jgi:hypothetical protein